MKKILLCTTAMAGASLMMAGAALSAEKPTLQMSGYLRFEAWSVDEDIPSASSRDVGFEMDDVEIHFDGSATADNGLEYGFHIELQEGEADRQAGYDVANIYMAGNWGRVELGSTPGVEDIFKVGAVSVMADLDGAWDGTLNFNTVSNAAYIGSNMQGNTGDSNKINYYTPELGGFTAGIGFVPNANAAMDSGLGTETQDTGINVVEAAIKYTATFNEVSVEVSARGLTGDPGANDTDDVSSEREDIQSWGVGAKLAYAGFELAGSYTDNEETGVTKQAAASGTDAGGWWDVGMAYGAGPFKVSVAYMHSWAARGTGVQDDEIDYLSIGGVYGAAPGLDFYTTYQYVDLDRAGTASDNEASMFMVGTQVSF